jgi:hypothetical protein
MEMWPVATATAMLGKAGEPCEIADDHQMPTVEAVDVGSGG